LNPVSASPVGWATMDKRINFGALILELSKLRLKLARGVVGRLNRTMLSKCFVTGLFTFLLILEIMNKQS
jgi:hypothetical protein